MHPFLYSAILLLSFLFFGCSHSTPKNGGDFSSAVAVTKDLVSRYGEVPKAGFLSLVENRLKSHLNSEGITPNIILLRSNDRFAYSPGNGFIVLSVGLVRKLRSESAFAFVVAHELAHQVLGHTSRLHDYREETSSDIDFKALELGADRYAIGVVAISGYDPRSAVDALLSAYGSSDGASDSHPSLAERIYAIQESITDSRWTPPGIVDSRDYRKFIAGILSLRY